MRHKAMFNLKEGHESSKILTLNLNLKFHQAVYMYESGYAA